MPGTTGRDSSTSAPSTSGRERHVLDEDGHAHGGPHFTLVIFPSGAVILTTPDHLSREEFGMVQELMQSWHERGGKAPLVIGNCRVVMAALPPGPVEVLHGSG